MSWQSGAKFKGQQRGAWKGNDVAVKGKMQRVIREKERQCHGSEGPDRKGSKKARKGNVMPVQSQTQRAARGHGKAMLGGNCTFLEAAATFSRNSSTTSFSFCSSMTHDKSTPSLHIADSIQHTLIFVHLYIAENVMIAYIML